MLCITAQSNVTLESIIYFTKYLLVRIRLHTFDYLLICSDYIELIPYAMSSIDRQLKQTMSRLASLLLHRYSTMKQDNNITT